MTEQKLTHFVVQTSTAKMPAKCWGTYRNVAVLELEIGFEFAAMISERARGVVRIVTYDGKRHVGRGNSGRCQYSKALAKARALCDELNAASKGAKINDAVARLAPAHEAA